MIVMVVADQDEVDLGQVLEAHTWRADAAGTALKEGKGMPQVRQAVEELIGVMESVDGYVSSRERELAHVG